MLTNREIAAVSAVVIAVGTLIYRNRKFNIQVQAAELKGEQNWHEGFRAGWDAGYDRGAHCERFNLHATEQLG